MAMIFTELSRDPKVKGLFDDITIKVGNTTLYADSHMLKYFEYFRKMMEGEWKESKSMEIEIKDFNPKTVELFLKSVYVGLNTAKDTIEDLDDLLDLMIFMDKYGIDIHKLILTLKQKAEMIYKQIDIQSILDGKGTFNEVSIGALHIVNTLHKLPCTVNDKELNEMLRYMHVHIITVYAKCKECWLKFPEIEKYILSDECKDLNTKIMNEIRGKEKDNTVLILYKCGILRTNIFLCYIFSCCIEKKRPNWLPVRYDGGYVLVCLIEFCKTKKLNTSIELLCDLLLCTHGDLSDINSIAEKLLSEEDFNKYK